MNFYHLSHTDLDGYTCQFVTKAIHPDGYFVNANYGEEVMARIEEILSLIEREAKEAFFLISDLNLSPEEAAYLDERIKELQKVIPIKLQLLDHHLSGLETSLRYEWYHLDSTKSASLITYEYFQNETINSYERLIHAVNAVDIWLSEEELFEFGKVLMRAIEEAKEINRITFNQENLLYRHHMLQSALEYLQHPQGHIAFDDALWSIKKKFFIHDQNDTMDNLVTSYILTLLNAKKDQMSITYKEHKGILTYGIQNSSIVGNAFLKANPEYHFFMNVSSRGTFSLRADNKMDVSLMADAIAGGGGHPNASGGRIKEFKEFFRYDELKAFINQLLQNSA